MSGMLTTLAVMFVFLGTLVATARADKKDQGERLANAAEAVREILALPEGIPGAAAAATTDRILELTRDGLRERPTGAVRR